MNDTSKSGFAALAKEQSLYPQDAPARLSKKPNSLTIGVPKEVVKREKRVSLKPSSCLLYTSDAADD